MNCEMTSATKKQIADLFRVHVNTVDGWTRAGLPHRKDGREYRFDLADAIVWHHQFIASTSGDLPSHAEAKRRREHYLAELKRLQYETAEGLLINKEKAMNAWRQVLLTVRDRFLGLPAKLAPLVYSAKSPAEAFVTLKKEIHEILDELSEDKHDKVRTKKVRKLK